MRGCRRFSPVTRALEFGKVQAVRKFIEAGVEFSDYDVHTVLRGMFLIMVDLLAENGVSLDVDGDSAICTVFGRGFRPIACMIKAVLRHNPKPDDVAWAFGQGYCYSCYTDPDSCRPLGEYVLDVLAQVNGSEVR